MQTPLVVALAVLLFGCGIIAMRAAFYPSSVMVLSPEPKVMRLERPVLGVVGYFLVVAAGITTLLIWRRSGLPTFRRLRALLHIG